MPCRAALDAPWQASSVSSSNYSVSSQYSVDSSVPRHVSVAELSRSLLSDGWSVSLSSLLPPGGPGLTSAEINSALSWSCKTVSSDPSNGGSLG